MANWPTLSGLVMWMPETLTAASIAGQKEVIDNDREDWKRISASIRKQPDALRYDPAKLFLAFVRERPIDIHKDPVALNKYICEYLDDKGRSLRMKKQTWALLMFSSHQKHKLMQWKLRYLISQK